MLGLPIPPPSTRLPALLARPDRGPLHVSHSKQQFRTLLSKEKPPAGTAGSPYEDVAPNTLFHPSHRTRCSSRRTEQVVQSVQSVQSVANGAESFHSPPPRAYNLHGRSFCVVFDPTYPIGPPSTTPPPAKRRRVNTSS